MSPLCQTPPLPPNLMSCDREGTRARPVTATPRPYEGCFRMRDAASPLIRQERDIRTPQMADDRQAGRPRRLPGQAKRVDGDGRGSCGVQDCRLAHSCGNPLPRATISQRGPPSQGPGGRHGTLRSARRGRIPVSTPAPDRSRKRDMTRARRPAIAWRPALAAAALRLVPATTRAAGPGSTAAGPPPGGFSTVAEAARGQAQFAANCDGSRLHRPITGSATVLVLGLPR